MNSLQNDLNMIRDTSRLVNQKYDLLVIGGGINGAAIAHLAAACGASVALIEKNDFASGTSSKSTKLLHGGIRYLENFEFDLVCESLKERYIQWKAAPHLVKPLGFVVPVYKNDRRPLWLMKLGIWLYDSLSGPYRLGESRFLSVNDIIAVAPGINTQDLVGAVQYFDAQMDDARLCLENILMADQYGAAVANYVQALDFIKEKGQAIGVVAKDLLNGNALNIMASNIIVAAGPWSDTLIQKDTPHALKRLRLTKGTHLVYKGQISSRAFLLQSHQDRRVFFVIPFKGNTLIGTTDTDYDQDIDKVQADEKDIQYLLQEASRVFPHIRFDRSEIITTFAGLRPLVADSGEAAKVSRKHVIERHDSGIYFVIGGKYTTYRAIAEEAVMRALPSCAPGMPHPDDYSVYGSKGRNEEFKILSKRLDVPIDLLPFLEGIYGSRFIDVLHLTRDNPSLKKKICSCSPVILAQLVYARDVEMAKKPEDIIERRLGLSYLSCAEGSCRRAIVEIFRSHL